MNGPHSLPHILLGTALALALLYIGVRLVAYARKRSAGAYALGAALMLFGVGNVQDPPNEKFLEAQQPKPRKGNESGDPPDDEAT